MDERQRIATLHRRFGLGLPVGTLADAVNRGVDIEVGRILSPTEAGIAPTPDPLVGVDLTDAGVSREQRAGRLAAAWLTRMVSTDRPLEDRMSWFWHNLLVTSALKTRVAPALANQLRLFWGLGTGSLPDLYRAITVDPAMLDYLDGRDSTGSAPNENYGRELLELFALGVGNFTENDVRAAAAALTGWTTVKQDDKPATFVTRRHNDGPQQLLGTTVHDVASVIEAVTKHPACALFLAGKVGRALLGPGLDPASVTSLAASFTTSNLSVAALVRAAIDMHLAGVTGGPIVLGPVPWLVMAERATGARVRDLKRIGGLRAAGQVPFYAPNVAGWPGGQSWYGSSTMVARLNLAGVIAQATPPTSPALTAAKASDWPALSRALGLPADFAATTVTALSLVPDTFSRLAIALVSPEFVEV